MRKVAILGLSPSKADAPFDDPEWELWGLAWDPDALRMHRAFEMHEEYEDAERLAHFPVLYMQQKYLPNATAYPFAEVAESVGDWWESSVAYAMALAIHEGADEIGLWGVDMKADDEYGYQQPNMTYLIGLARGRGIKVRIHESSPLCRYSGKFGYAGRYGRTK